MLCFLLLAALQAQTAATLLVDLNPVPNTQLPGVNSGNANAEVLGAALGRIWLRADVVGVESDLWSVESLAAPPEPWYAEAVGLERVRAVRVAALDASRMLVALDGNELVGTYVTSGATGDALRVSEFTFEEALVEDGVAYLFQDPPGPGRQLLRTDGTPAGTQLLGPIETLGSLFAPGLEQPLVNGVRRTVFSAGESLVYAVSVSSTTSVLAQPKAGGAPVLLRELKGETNTGRFTAVEVGGDLLFTGVDLNADGSVLWKTDGTPEGTSVLFDFLPDPGDGNPILLSGDGVRAVLDAVSPGAGRALHVSDGTVAGTGLLADPASPPNSGVPLVAVPANGGFVFAYTSFPDPDLSGYYYADAVGPGAVRVTPPDFPYSIITPAFTGIQAVPGGAVFWGPPDLWFSDGTPGGTFALTGGDLETLGSVAGVDGRLWFAAKGPATGRELYVAEPAPASAQLAVDLGKAPVTFSSGVGAWGAVGQGLAASSAGSVIALTDGTVAGTELVVGGLFNSTRVSSIFGGGVLFAAFSSIADQGYEPWYTNGTEAGTVSLGDLALGSASSFASASGRSAVLGNRALFLAEGTDLGGDLSLWSTDGTPSGTDLVLGSLSGEPSGGDTRMVRAGREVFFALEEDSVIERLRLWKTDGTAAGTGPVPGPAFTKLTELTEADGRPFFVGLEPGQAPDRSVWTVAQDGGGSLEPGLVRVLDVPAFATLRPVAEGLVVIGGGRVSAIDPHDLAVTAVQSFGSAGYGVGFPFAGRGDLAYFEVVAGEAPDGSLATGVYATDGTAAGTRFVAPSGGPGSVIGSDGRALFRFGSSATGPEPWLTDGTPEGTELWLDSVPGIVGSLPGITGSLPSQITSLAEGARVGNEFVYRGYDPVSGYEPHAISVIEAGSYVSEPFGTPCSDAAPDLSVDGDLRIGSTVDLALRSGPPLSTTRIYVSTMPAEVPLDACTLYLYAPTPLTDLVLGGDGSTSLPLSVPDDPQLVGASLFLQGANLVTGGGFAGLADLTNAVELVIGG